MFLLDLRDNMYDDYQAFNVHRNKLNVIMDKVKGKYYTDRITENKNDQKELFHIIKQLLHSDRKNS